MLRLLSSGTAMPRRGQVLARVWHCVPATGFVLVVGLCLCTIKWAREMIFLKINAVAKQLPGLSTSRGKC